LRHSKQAIATTAPDLRIPSVKAAWTRLEWFGDIGAECDTMIVSTKG
jgi:hypothetical protein